MQELTLVCSDRWKSKPSSQDIKCDEKAIVVPGRERTDKQGVPPNQNHKSLNLEKKGQCEILPFSLNQVLQIEIWES